MTHPTENPYASPLPTPLAITPIAPVKPIEFSGEMTHGDLVAAFRSSNRVVVDLVILSMFIIALIISTTLYIRFGRSGALDVILVSSLASLFMVYRLYRDLGFQRARSLLAQFPQTLGPIQGRFIEKPY